FPSDRNLQTTVPPGALWFSRVIGLSRSDVGDCGLRDSVHRAGIGLVRGCWQVRGQRALQSGGETVAAIIERGTQVRTGPTEPSVQFGVGGELQNGLVVAVDVIGPGRDTSRAKQLERGD